MSIWGPACPQEPEGSRQTCVPASFFRAILPSGQDCGRNLRTPHRLLLQVSVCGVNAGATHPGPPPRHHHHPGLGLATPSGATRTRLLPQQHLWCLRCLPRAPACRGARTWMSWPTPSTVSWVGEMDVSRGNTPWEWAHVVPGRTRVGVSRVAHATPGRTSRPPASRFMRRTSAQWLTGWHLARQGCAGQWLPCLHRHMCEVESTTGWPCACVWGDAARSAVQGAAVVAVGAAPPCRPLPATVSCSRLR